MKYVYGPVPSRRLGQSLGVDTIPLKTCNWNCVYCQLGRTRPLTNKRREYIPRQDILAEVKRALKNHRPEEIDWITFVGSGEPLLHDGTGWLIREVKALTDIPVAVITNGSLLYLPEVREELLAADAVLPSLDAGTHEHYRRINRPHPAITFKRLLTGLISFQEEYDGRLWVEVMLVQNLNDTDDALREIANALKQIQPDQVHIVQPTRPPVETWVQPPTEEGLMRAIAILGDVAQIVHPAAGSFDLSDTESLVEGIIAIITRHPMRENELLETLERWSTKDVKTALVELENSDQAQVIERYGVRFWSAAPSYFPKEAQSQRTDPRTSHQDQVDSFNQ